MCLRTDWTWTSATSCGRSPAKRKATFMAAAKAAYWIALARPPAEPRQEAASPTPRAARAPTEKSRVRSLADLRHRTPTPEKPRRHPAEYPHRLKPPLHERQGADLDLILD